MADDSEVAIEFEIGSKTCFANVSPYQGKQYASVRFYYEDRDTGQLKPGRNGINIQVTDGPEDAVLVAEMLLEALNQHFGTSYVVVTDG